MFSRANLHGGKAAILYGYRTAVELTHWRVIKNHPTTVEKGFTALTGKATWQLSGTVGRVDAFFARQKPLLLAVPRPKNGFFLWPVKSIDFLGPNSIKATLEQPER